MLVIFASVFRALSWLCSGRTRAGTSSLRIGNTGTLVSTQPNRESWISVSEGIKSNHSYRLNEWGIDANTLSQMTDSQSHLVYIMCTYPDVKPDSTADAQFPQQHCVERHPLSAICIDVKRINGRGPGLRPHSQYEAGLSLRLMTCGMKGDSATGAACGKFMPVPWYNLSSMSGY